jgi:hypothetical protein
MTPLRNLVDRELAGQPPAYVDARVTEETEHEPGVMKCSEFHLLTVERLARQFKTRFAPKVLDV